jgi:hypothetical protein
MTEPPPAPPSITCPAPRCRAENPPTAQNCAGCGLPLGGYCRLTLHPAGLFNRGLQAARAGQHAAARDLFAAVVHWHPHDLEARNAYALACAESGDQDAARAAWEAVLLLAPADGMAIRGLDSLRPPARRPPRSKSRRMKGKRHARPAGR